MMSKLLDICNHKPFTYSQITPATLELIEKVKEEMGVGDTTVSEEPQEDEGKPFEMPNEVCSEEDLSDEDVQMQD